jgi:hypothetical protein
LTGALLPIRRRAYNARPSGGERRDIIQGKQWALAFALALPCGGGERPAIGTTIEELRFTDMH